MQEIFSIVEFNDFIKDVHFFGHKKLFTGIDETIGPKDRIALVGSNGSGKTIFLRMLMGQVVPDEGQVEKPDYATVGYLPQDGVSAKGCSMREEVAKAFSGMTELKQKLDDAEVKLGEMDPEAEEFYDLIDLMGAWEEQLASFEPEKMNSRIEKVMTGMGFSLEILIEKWMNFRVVGRCRMPWANYFCKVLLF